jgi:hypothetical protein
MDLSIHSFFPGSDSLLYSYHLPVANKQFASKVLSTKRLLNDSKSGSKRPALRSHRNRVATAAHSLSTLPITQPGTANHPLGPPPTGTLSTPPAATAIAQPTTKRQLPYFAVTYSTVIVPVSIAIRPHHERGEQAVQTLTTGTVTTSAQSAKIADILLPRDRTIPVSPASCRLPYRVRSTSPSIPLVAALTTVRGVQGFRSRGTRSPRGAMRARRGVVSRWSIII